MRKVSIGVSPISLKKNRCSKHFKPMERSAGSRRRSLANLGGAETEGEDRGDELRTPTVQAAAVWGRYLPCCSGYLCLQ